ncbi:MAG: iron-containing alcohol dehydrogenase [Desulfitobacteriaceae bacterium]
MKELFGFYLPTRIEMGNGLLRETGRLTQSVTNGKKALVVTDPGILQVGIAAEVMDSLSRVGFTTELFDKVEPNPKDFDCVSGGEAAREFEADVILAVGGGSVIDSAKVIALLQTHPGTVQDYEGRGKVKNRVTPIIAVPTTAGTGSEVTRSAVITDTKRKFKMTVKDVKLAPALAIVDPETTYGLPQLISASTGMDAFVHAIEAYTSRVANPMSDAMALAAMERIFLNLRIVAGDGRDQAARYNMMVGSLMAGIAFSHADVAAVHCMAEALGGLYDTPHGVANSIFLPVVTAFNAPADPIKHARVAAVCGIPVAGLSEDEASECLVAEVKRIAQDIGIPKLTGLGYVDPVDFERLAEASYQNGSTPDNCREITKDDYLLLFQEAYEA